MEDNQYRRLRRNDDPPRRKPAKPKPPPKKRGAPRTVSPDDEGIRKLGEEIVEWIRKPDTKTEKKLHMKQWWCLEKGMSKVQWDALCDKKEFMPYYEQARIGVAIKYINGTVNPSIANRFLRLYFPELEKNENEKSAFEAGLRKEIAQEFDGKLGEVLDLLQKVKSEKDFDNKAK